MFNLKIIIASTRPGRKGPAIGSWIYDLAKKNSAFEVTILDLAIINLPFFDEPHHPRLKKYQHEHTKNWSILIDNADAFIIVTPEYNYGYPATIKNALDFLYNEWNYKPVGFVSYGGIAGGTRSVQMLKQVVTCQKMMPIPESVNLPFFTKYLNEQEGFVPEEGIIESAGLMLAELAKWAAALKTMRKS
ncbi:MAG: NAD(P)H-dependent oxidoreductase [Ferruginibacter sp.]|nr:NAD(P)H-dependent oxidoreductase [Ferruginibacter sp.]